MTGQRQCKIEKSTNSANGTYSGGHQSLSVELFKVKKYPKTRNVFNFFELTAKPSVGSWKT